MIGLRIDTRKRCVAEDLVAAFAAIPVANVSDVMERIYSAPSSLRAIHDGSPLCGPAVTVRTPPGDNLMVHKALDIAMPGDVVVVDSGGDTTNAIIGEMMVSHAIYRKLGGIVIHGAIRDFDTLSKGSFPIFASGVTHRGPYKNGPGEINAAIALGSMVIEAGDLIMGDGDGIISVPYGAAAQILSKAQAKYDQEVRHAADLEKGAADRSWIDEKLKSLGCAFDA